MKITSKPNGSLLGFVNGYLPLSVVVFALEGSDFMAKRRANGEGNIRKRKDGRWEGRYTAGYDPVTGKQVFKNPVPGFRQKLIFRVCHMCYFSPNACNRIL